MKLTPLNLRPSANKIRDDTFEGGYDLFLIHLFVKNTQ